MTSDDDVELFACGYYRRFGVDARWRALDQSVKLAASGDDEGERVWRRVAVAVERLNAGADRSGEF